MIARRQLTQQRGRHRRHAGRLRPARLGTLHQRDAFLEHLDGEVLQPRVGHARDFAAEAGGGGLGIVVGVARGQEQRLAGLAELRAQHAALHEPGLERHGLQVQVEVRGCRSRGGGLARWIVLACHAHSSAGLSPTKNPAGAAYKISRRPEPGCARPF